MLILRKIIILWLSTAFFIASCTGADHKSEIIPTSSSMIGITASATPTGTPIPILPSLTPTILPIIPTLPDEEAYTLLSDMLHAGNKCELPCWFNITPGNSSHSDAHYEWGSFLSVAGTTIVLPRDYLYEFNYETNGYDIYIDTRYYLSPDSELIESMSVSTQVLRYKEIGSSDRVYIFDSTTYRDLLHAYLLPNTLSTYGPPAQIFLSMEIHNAEPTAPDFFSIWLLYPTRGAIVRYQGSAEVKEGIIHGCPSDTFVSLWLVSSENSKLYQETLEDVTVKDIVATSPFYKSTMDAIGMTAEDFYDEFKKPSSRCIESPLDIWPEH